MTAGAGVGQLARQRWDQAYSRADLALRQARTAASAAGVDWLVRWFTIEISQLATLQAAVDGKRRKPGTGSSGLIYDVPPDLQLLPAGLARLSERSPQSGDDLALHLNAPGLGAAARRLATRHRRLRTATL